jgi:drug/metabolite transporter (DMT)-like permease
MTISVAFALAAALSSAINLLTQHSASAGAPKREKGWRLVSYLFRQPPWLLGWAAAAGAFACQATALHHGQLSVVQPILVTELVFVLVLRRIWIRQDVARAAWAAALIVCGALATFLVAAEPTGGHSSPETAQWLSALLTFGGALALLAVLGTRGSPTRRSALLAAAAGLAWALTATFLKTTTETLATLGIGGMLTDWPVYALVATVIAGMLLNQSALHVGPLSASQPLLVIINPLASIALSVWLFDERFTDSPARIAIAVVAMAVMFAGVIALSRTAPKDLNPSKDAYPPVSLGALGRAELERHHELGDAAEQGEQTDPASSSVPCIA